MEEYLGLLLSFTEGLNFPKKKLYLNVYIRYSFGIIHRSDIAVTPLLFLSLMEERQPFSTKVISSAM